MGAAILYLAGLGQDLDDFVKIFGKNIYILWKELVPRPWIRTLTQVSQIAQQMFAKFGAIMSQHMFAKLGMPV